MPPVAFQPVSPNSWRTTGSQVGEHATTSGGTSHDLLPKAKEFESILLGQWLQAAESTFGSVPGDEEDAGAEQMRSFAVQQLAKGLSNTGGIGLAPLVAEALSKQQRVQKAVKEIP